MNTPTELYALIDKLPAEALVELQSYIQGRLYSVWAVPPEAIRSLEKDLHALHARTAHMPEDEINALIDEAIAEARHEQHS